MPLPAPEAWSLAERYRLGIQDTPRRGTSGERLGKGTGSSLEFQERRAYVPGDDVRHLDWGAYARTDQLMVRLYRDEVLPQIELLVDGSRSMEVDQEKAQLCTDLVALLMGSGRAAGFRVRLTLVGDRPEVVEFDRFQREGIEFKGTTRLQDGLSEALTILRPASVRILVSDFLSPHDSSSLVRSLAAGAGGVALLQVLGREDADPPLGSALRLTDVETDEVLDLVLDRKSIELYVQRLRRLTDALEVECRRAGGRFLTMVSSGSLSELCRAVLLPEGVLVPA